MKEIDRDQSEFNMAVSYLNRLNALFYLCNDAAMELDPHTWFHALMALFRELSTEQKAEEITEKEKEIEAIHALVETCNRDTHRTGQSTVSPALYWRLHKFEMYLRNILKKAGLQYKMKDDPGQALRG